METTEFFSEFINGNLNETIESSFFKKLSINNELREDFRSFLTITDSINANKNKFAPTSALTNSVFISLGLAPNNSNQLNPIQTRKSAFWSSKVFVGIASSLITVLLMVSSYLFFKNQESGIETTLNNHPLNIPQNSDPNQTEKVLDDDKPKNNSIIKYIVIEKENLSDSETTPIVSESNTVHSISKCDDLTEEFHSKLINQDVNKYLLTVNSPNDLSIYENNSGNVGIELEVKANSVWNIPTETIYPSKQSPFQNLGLSIMYNLTDKMQIGADLRQETFFCKYNGYNDEGSFYEYWQQPNFTTFSALMRYKLFTFYNIIPYTQIGVGINKGGYVVRPSAGFEIFYSPELSFLLGLEYSFLGFTHQEKQFSATKYGINYSINFKF